jgi:ATP-dependent helicase/nuclease subunit B
MTRSSSYYNRVDTEAGQRVEALPMAELPAATPAAEARLALVVVAELLARDVPIRDIAVVARDVDRYEAHLRSAARQCGLALTIWTQLPLTTTDPYRLCHSLCQLLGASTVDVETLVAPLDHGWVPPTPSEAWPYDPGALRRLVCEAPSEERDLEWWHQQANTAPWGNDRLDRYLRWLRTRPATPSPQESVETLGQMLERYRERVLPHRKRQDDPALQETVRTARATSQMRVLCDRVETKYTAWLRREWASRGWETVADICRLLATQRPGRREHANARALDVIEANDTWARCRPYVVAVGLTDGIWPQQETPLVPAQIRSRIIAGADGLGRLAPRFDGTAYKERDQFGDTVAMATAGLVFIRPLRDATGTQQPRSPLLDSLPVTPSPPSAVREFLQGERLPDALTAVLPGVSTTRTAGATTG